MDIPAAFPLAFVPPIPCEYGRLRKAVGVPSDYTVVPSADFIVPSPSYAPGRRSIAANNPRAHFGQYDLPPPSPPPRGPLPSVPSGLHLDPTQLPLPYSPGGRSPSLSPRSASPLFSQPIPAIQRGRETPFPARPVLPPQESSELVRRTTTAARNVVWKQQREGVPDILINVEDATDDGGSVIRADPGPDFDPHVRPDIAQFYFAHAAEREGAPSGRVSPSGMPYDRDAESVYVDDDRSLYPDDARTLETHRRRSAVDSYYFDSEAGQQRMSVWSRRASFMDDEKSGEVRSRLITRVGQMHQEEVPPVPKIRPF
ncbi:hypothetical protein DENSPDRAFT_871283 [Dentipellis sp. KUC8613]|nr:hypothetical protein DENSPDRAFT_871283 [Dentipellis sp. KUC8613]